MKQIKVTLVRSIIGRPIDQKRTAAALGLKKLNHSKIFDDRPDIRGMIRKIEHLVKVEEI
ncbi:MAG TPA: 50S ribosomal protein L30 [Bacteroidales bacterium]|jgi:large subunit ribosomal protein L30|nr:50S ribosomal protein L30 [Bacteroidales bacterium]OQC44785.1 MAG: 50S ribosomal protein L30 [Bacteroidetes bacterium ADurb.Bin035]MBP8945909.1 50S ribosomal protein L30 [Bacteroidales bacterium]HCM29816.1 50S ribosomal protein L30 [Bacteroidales bacterium]HNT70094.1 50S ribosomal protein L30 [Bacteroidales bacterium]